MKKLLNPLAVVVDRVVWAVGCFAIIDYASNHWPLSYRVATVVILVAFGAWYMWAFFVRPFREGLKGQGATHVTISGVAVETERQRIATELATLNSKNPQLSPLKWRFQ